MSQSAIEPPSESHFGQYVTDQSASQLSMAVLNASRPEPIERMVHNLFGDQPVEVTGDPDLDHEGDAVVLLADGEVVASSPLRALEETILMVNSDLYRTGTVELEQIELPAVIAALSETTFHVRGYPESHYEKMPLILISRHIERLSYTHGGTHRASFQRLSRLRDEIGTQNVYQKLSASGVDTHIYGVPDWLPPRELDLKIHAGYGGDFDVSWFVVHRSEDSAAALVALEVGPNEWLGRWTFDPDTVTDIEATITQYL